ncbi:MAG: hypothetical protein C0404_09455 [Verrucomicrobia bacterium]|nr:hypothetical protein [Verrucomicrobiota bacterium]
MANISARYRVAMCVTSLGLSVFSATPAAGQDLKKQARAWEPVGISGGGSMYAPAISPVDPKVMMINCDMSAAYLSRDGGLSWNMIHHEQLPGNTFCQPTFHPRDSNTIFAASGWWGKLMVSHDGGATWNAAGQLPKGLRGQIAIDPGNPGLMMAGTHDGGWQSKDGSVWRSTDGGKHWVCCEGPQGVPISFHFDQSSPPDKRTCFAATAYGVWRSDDSGKTWAEKSAGLPWRDLQSFAGGSSTTGKTCILYCSIPAKVHDGQYTGGIWRSLNRGETWESAMGDGINKDTQAADQWSMGKIAEYRWVLTTDINPMRVYALNLNTGVKPPHHATVYRSDDGGKSWLATFHPDQRFEGLNVELDWRATGAGQHYQEKPFGAAICPTNPDWLIFSGSMTCYVTDNGGKTWRPAHTRNAQPGAAKTSAPAWLCNGLVVTTTWNYYMDPFESNRHYIAYTDIGFARSLDAGKSWSWWDSKTWPPWQNTCYELAFDPEIKGRIWAAFSNVHDIPNSNIVLERHRAEGPGGVCVSTDFGATWKASNQGIPLAPVTSVVVDTKSRSGSRTLYAGVFGHGVFKSTDDGATWIDAGKGIGSPSNRRVCRVVLHSDGTLFALVTGMRKDGKFVVDGAGLYRSTDGAATWQLINKSQPFLWPKDFTVAPGSSKTIYVGACDADKGKQGGLYRTTDAGSTWHLLARKGPEHFGAYLHPKHAGWIYMTLTEGAPGPGLWLSKDDGKTWSALDSFPFRNVQRVVFDPAAAGMIYVTTFGGSVWRGPED